MVRILGPCLGRVLENPGARTGFCKADGMGLMAGMMDDKVYMEKDFLGVFCFSTISRLSDEAMRCTSSFCYVSTLEHF